MRKVLLLIILMGHMVGSSHKPNLPPSYEECTTRAIENQKKKYVRYMILNGACCMVSLGMIVWLHSFKQ